MKTSHDCQGITPLLPTNHPSHYPLTIENSMGYAHTHGAEYQSALPA